MTSTYAAYCCARTRLSLVLAELGSRSGLSPRVTPTVPGVCHSGLSPLTLFFYFRCMSLDICNGTTLHVVVRVVQEVQGVQLRRAASAPRRCAVTRLDLCPAGRPSIVLPPRDVFSSYSLLCLSSLAWSWFAWLLASAVAGGSAVSCGGLSVVALLCVALLLRVTFAPCPGFHPSCVGFSPGLLLA